MKKYLKNILTLTFFVILLLTNKVSAVNNIDNYDINMLLNEINGHSSFRYYTKGYTIDNYDIDMVVNEDNTFEITEKITAYFSVPKHGIYRKIPLRNSVIRNDGTRFNNRAKVSNISVSEDYTVSKENGYKNIKIGDSNQTFTGVHLYTIKYKYDIGKDPLKDADELYFNLIGDEWDTSISNVNFKITMPKQFDESLLGFSSGYKGSTNSLNVTYSVDKNVITGYINEQLDENQALTVRLTLPEGYFVRGNSKTELLYFAAVIIFCLICVLIADRLWSKYGKDDQVIETVEFYPPEGYNSAEIAFLYKGEADTEGVISLLIYLADKGYLKIKEIEEKGIFKKKGFKIIKLKEYDGNNKEEKLFFDGLFKSTPYSVRDQVTDSDLYDEFYITLDKIKERMNSKANKNKIFESSSRGKGKWLISMSILIFILITARPILEYGEPEALINALLFPGIGFTVLIGSLIEMIKIPKIFGIIWGGIFGGLPWAYFMLPALTQNIMYLIMYIIGIISIAVIFLFIKIMPKRNSYGNEMLGKIKGFKRFLETAEKLELESLVEKNPEYFYNILPYTYALGVSDKWISQFETIALKAPDWYDSKDAFNMNTFGTFMNTTMRSAATAMSSSPSSSGGGSSGGGSSGGGSGGGGGGSW